MATKRFYFFTPTNDTPPNGPIALGNIIESPLFADQPLNKTPIPIQPTDIVKHEKKNYTLKRDKQYNGRLGVFLSFLLQILSIGGDGSVDGSWGDNDELTAKLLETRSFVPSLEYLRQSYQNATVQRFILKSKTWTGSSKLYMVTGLKIAHGASFAVEKIREGNVKLHVGVDGTNAGIPVTVGPDVETGMKISQKESFGDADPFVFAFRLQQIIITAEKDIEHKPFTKGAPLGVGTDDHGATGPEIRVSRLESGDADARELDLETWNVVDDETGEDCVCARAGEIE
jgi:hypothetical protein